MENKSLYSKLIEEIKNNGYIYSTGDCDKIVFDATFRCLCEQNTCSRYNKNWSCPPAIGSVEKLIDDCKKYDKCIMFSSVVALEDSFDIEAMTNGRKKISSFYINLIKKYQLYQYDGIKVLGCESCELCEKCSYPEKPCRNPDLLVPTLEGCGIDVVKTSKNFDLNYYNGSNTVTYFALILFKEYKVTMNNKTFYALCGDNLLELFQKNNVIIPASCGGIGKCHKCKVKIDDYEVLSCEYSITKDCTIDNQELALDEKEVENSKENLRQGRYGIAVDLGTTTIALSLVDLENKKTIDTISQINKQVIYGADVISRINCCDEKLRDLHKVIVDEINEEVQKLIDRYQIAEIEKLMVSGNPTMLHLLAGVSPKSIGIYPFLPKFLDTYEIDLHNPKIKKTILLPSIDSYVGSDITSGILYSHLDKKSGNVMLIDLGTNGEMVLKTPQVFVCASTAAGPAFEGANIECGMGGVIGAINQVDYLNGEIKYQTIGNKTLGICGSGLVDIIAILLQVGIINEMGEMKCCGSSLDKYLKDNRFYISNDVYISLKDIGEVQLAKSAIVSGINTLMNIANIDHLDSLYIAGGFGFHLDINKAKYIGLIPDIKEIEVIGNSSLYGTIMCLLDNEKIIETEKISKMIKSYDLANNEIFNEEFINNILFLGGNKC